MDAEDKDNLFKVLKQVVDLEEDELAELAGVLKYTSLSNITRLVKMIEDRQMVIQGLKELVFNKEMYAKEVPHIQSIVENHYWLFGEQYNLITAAEPDFTLALKGLILATTGKEEDVDIDHEDKNKEMEEKKPKSWCKSISAFANCFGGKLIFGVSNDNELVGLADAEGDAEKISEAIKTHLNPIPEFKLYFEKDGEKIFVIVEVMKGQQTPYYYEGDGQLIAFMRIGNESVPATPSQLRELVLRGSGESYDSLKSRYDFDNMSFTKLKSVYKQRTGNTFEDTDYESFGLIDEKGNLTNAGALLADESPVRHSRLFCTRWNGLSKASGIVDALDDKEYTGSLVTLLQDGTDFVRNNSKKAWRKVGDGRIEMPDYPDRAVLEGVVNALIHRNYMEIGSEVHIDMFDDRIEIYSPGGMVSGISLEGKDLLKIPSKRRNPILADIFSRLKYMERRGSGFKKILADYEGQVEFDETKMPVFEADNDDFTLTLYNLNYGSNYAIHANEEKIQGDTQDDTQGDTQDDTEEKIIKMIKDNPQVSTADMAKELKIGIATVKRKIKKMSNVSYVGSGYSGHWEING